MVDQKDEILVEVDDKPVEPPIPAPSPVLTADEGIEDLKRNLAAEKQARLDAETRAREAETRVRSVKAEAEDANLTIVKNAIDATKRDQAIARQDFIAAQRNGDYEAAADAQQAMATSAARLLQLENGKAALESRPKQEPEPQRQLDPVEALAQQLSPRSAAWVRAHPEYARDSRLFNKMVAADQLVRADGIQADTDEYFEAVEDTLKIRRPVQQEPEPVAPPARRSSPPSAPVRSSTATGRNVIRLTAEEREMASMMGMTDEAYAKNKAELIAQGRIH
jgi:hypothetical protein